MDPKIKEAAIDMFIRDEKDILRNSLRENDFPLPISSKLIVTDNPMNNDVVVIRDYGSLYSLSNYIRQYPLNHVLRYIKMNSNKSVFNDYAREKELAMFVFLTKHPGKYDLPTKISQKVSIRKGLPPSLASIVTTRVYFDNSERSIESLSESLDVKSSTIKELQAAISSG